MNTPALSEVADRDLARKIKRLTRLNEMKMMPGSRTAERLALLEAEQRRRKTHAAQG